MRDLPEEDQDEIVGDLLAVAVDERERDLPSCRDDQVAQHPEHGAIFRLHGQRIEFRRLADTLCRKFEKSMGNKNAPDLYDQELHDSDD